MTTIIVPDSKLEAVLSAGTQTHRLKPFDVNGVWHLCADVLNMPEHAYLPDLLGNIKFGETEYPQEVEDEIN